MRKVLEAAKITIALLCLSLMCMFIGYVAGAREVHLLRIDLEEMNHKNYALQEEVDYLTFDSSELKSCEYCGGRNIKLKKLDSTHYCVVCDDCLISTGICGSVDSASKAWNDLNNKVKE